MKPGTDMLWLSESDVRSLLTMEDALAAVEQEFRLHAQGQTQMPSKIYLGFDPFGGDLRAMPAYLKGARAAGVKIVTTNPTNPERGLPNVAGLMVYVDPETGMPLGVFGAGALTALRTGAAGGLAAKYLARKDAKTLALVGCGRQAETQLDALSHFFPFSKISVWGKTTRESSDFIARHAQKYPGMTAFDNVRDALADADIIVTTTPVHEPVVKAAWVKAGAHINAIGADAPGKQEWDTERVLKARVIVDEWHQSSHAGELNVPVSQGRFSQNDLAAELGQVMTQQKPGRLTHSDITIFDSTGLAIQDVATAQRLYEKAVKLNKGQVQKLHG
jgi:alanine dehydrogenase